MLATLHRITLAALALACLSLGFARPAAAQQQQPQGQRPSLGRGRTPDAPQGALPGYLYDEQGRALRITFPLYDRISFGADTPIAPLNHERAWTSPAWHTRAELSLSLDFSDEQIWWMMRHRVLEASAAWRGEQGQLIDATLVQGSYLRHDLNSFVTIPTLNDLRVPAPFDLAVEYRLGRVMLERDDLGELELKRHELVEIGFLADFIRREDYRHRFAIGPVGWYHADTSEALWRHEVAPLSALMMLYGWDSDDGLISLKARAACGGASHFVASQEDTPSQWRWRCMGRAEAEWTILSVNDQPISLPLDVRVDVPLGDQPARPSALVTLGLRISLNLD